VATVGGWADGLRARAGGCGRRAQRPTGPGSPALAEPDLIDEYEVVVLPRIAGHGPTPLAGLPAGKDLVLLGRFEPASGALVLRCGPVRG
jgi:hypothetical protein